MSMNIQPKGIQETIRDQQSIAESPAGKATDSQAVDAGDATGDRGGDGRQVLDVFERREKESEPDESSAAGGEPPSAEGHIDFRA